MKKIVLFLILAFLLLPSVAAFERSKIITGNFTTPLSVKVLGSTGQNGLSSYSDQMKPATLQLSTESISTEKS